MSLAREYLYNLVTGKTKGPGAAFLRGILFILSLIYGFIVILLAGFYKIRRRRLPAKVVSVGNITLGGTGKTTLVQYLSVKLSAAGNKVAVLTRGYKRNAQLEGTRGMGDEPLMLAEKLPQIPVIVNKDRLKAARQAVRDYACDTLILDDGMQQWKLDKDLEIVTIDAANPFGNLRLLPAGFLREPLSALKRADIFVITQTSCVRDPGALADKLTRINPRALIVESNHAPKGLSPLEAPDKELGLPALKGKTAAVFSGIGNPEGFEKCLRGLGIKYMKIYRFPDHHAYTQNDILEILQAARKDKLEMVITTQKDAVKLRKTGIKDSGILVLEIKLEITKNEAEFDRRLLRLHSI